jgi:hypothetical protein
VIRFKEGSVIGIGNHVAGKQECQQVKMFDHQWNNSGWKNSKEKGEKAGIISC